MISKRTRNRLHRLFTAFMAVWLSGVVFVGWCGAMSGGSAEPVSCPLKKASDHCNKKAADSDLQSVVKTGDLQFFDCCGFIPLIFDKARKIDTRQADISTPATKSILRYEYTTAVEAGFVSFPRYKPPPKLQKLFITNRVLRI